MHRDVDRFAARRPPADALRRGSLCRPPPAARPQMHRDVPRFVTIIVIRRLGHVHELFNRFGERSQRASGAIRFPRLPTNFRKYKHINALPVPLLRQVYVGGFWAQDAPRKLQDDPRWPKTPQDAPKTLPRRSQDAPRCRQEAPKRPPGGAQEANLARKMKKI